MTDTTTNKTANTQNAPNTENTAQGANTTQTDQATTQETAQSTTKSLYYAYYDHTQKKQPIEVKGWYQIDGFTGTLPDKADLLPLTQEEWDSRDIQNSGVENGKLVYYKATPQPEPAAPAPLSAQAQRALNNTGSYLYQNYGMLNEPTPPDWVAYIKKLQDITNGKDTISTTLPKPPEDEDK